MKKIFITVLMLSVLIAIANCTGNSNMHEQATQNENNTTATIGEEPPSMSDYFISAYDDSYVSSDDTVIIDEAPTIESEFPLPEFAASFFAQLQFIWDKDNGQMWGTPLHSAVIIFCTDTRMVAANRPDAEGELGYMYIDGTTVYIGERGIWRGQISHGFWNNERAIFIRLQEMLDSPYQEMATIIHTHDVNIGLINHYIIHWMQHNGALPQGLGQSPGGSYSVENNISYMMEINALIEAIIAESGQQQTTHIHHALSIRDARRTNSRVYDLGLNENKQIVTEGFPTFTEMTLPLSADEIKYSITLWPEFILWRGQNISLSYAYFGGALYGILLDSLGISWRPYVVDDIDLGNLLIAYLGISYFIPLDEIDLEQYRYSVVSQRLREDD